jgi:type VII secretion effector (TIGR04197 family)
MTTFRVDPVLGAIISSSISTSVIGFNARALASPDTRTTLTANQNAQNAYAGSQVLVTSFSSAIRTAGNVLVSTSEAFRQADATAIQNIEVDEGISGPYTGNRQ